MNNNKKLIAFVKKQLTKYYKSCYDVKGIISVDKHSIRLLVAHKADVWTIDGKSTKPTKLYNAGDVMEDSAEVKNIKSLIRDFNIESIVK
jgi:hypothetical protein